MDVYRTIEEIRAAFYPRTARLLDLDPGELVSVPPGWPEEN